MSVSLTVLGTGSGPSHVPPSVLLTCAHARYLLGGAGDGTQRMATEAHLKLAKLNQLFITHINHDRVGGTTGLLITLADLGVKRVGVHAPGPLRHFLQAARNVSVRNAMTIEAHEIPREQDVQQAADAEGATKLIFEDTNISVEAVVLAEQRVCLPPLRPTWPQQQAAAAAAAAAQFAPANNQAEVAALEPVDASIDDSAVVHAAPAAELPPSKRVKHNHEQAASSAAAASSTAAAVESTAALVAVPAAALESRPEWVSSVQPALAAYIVRLASTPGKFDVNKARALGIPPGPLYSKLKAGESVSLRANEMIGAPGVGAKKKPKQQQQSKKSIAAAAAAATATPAVEAAAPVVDIPAVDDPVRTFHPSDCVAATLPGPVFALVDCPNHAFVSNLVAHRAFARFKTAADGSSSASTAPAASPAATSQSLTLLLHITPLSVLTLPAYKTWMGSFPSSTQHVLVHASTSVPRPAFRGAALNYLKIRRYVNDEVFPADIPVVGDDAPIEAVEEDTRALTAQIGKLFPAPLQVHPGQTLLRFHLSPPQNQALDVSGVLTPVRYPSEVEENLSEGSTPELTARLRRWKERMAAGKAQGVGVAQVAEQLRQEFDAEDAAQAGESMSDDTAVVPMAVEDYPSDLTSPPPSDSFDAKASASVLSVLAAEPEQLSPELVFLGTGSAIPSKYRNVTGQFFHPGYAASSVDLPRHPVGGVFIDCGEGSYGQLCLRYASHGVSAAAELVADLVADLKAIWVSHIHADHHLGLLALLATYKKRWTQRFKARHGKDTPLARMQIVSPWHAEAGSDLKVPRLLVVGPRRLFWWLKEYAASAFEVSEEDEVDASPANGAPAASEDAVTSASSSPPRCRTLFDWIEFVNCSELQERVNRLSPFFARDAPAASRLYPTVHTRSISVLHNVQVRHCNDAYGLIVETPAVAPLASSGAAPQPAYKLVISGDTQPCQALVDAGADATLLVHESTLEDEMIAEALAKRHSTTRQAVQVGLAMRAQRILLTHFSQRYPKLPTASSARSGHSSGSVSRTAIAFDLLALRFRALEWLPSLTPAFGLIFSESELKKYENARQDKEKEELAEFV